MEKKKTTAKIVLSLDETVLGNIMYAAAVALFIVSNGLTTGGTTGLVLFVNHSIGIPISLFVNVFNVLMFLLGAWVLGKQFALTIVLSAIIYPVVLRVLEGSGFGGSVLEEKLVAVLYAGLLIGGGIGIAIRAGASTGGMDIPALVPKRKLDINVSMTLYLMDCVVLGLQLTVVDSHAVLYSIILIIVYTIMLNQVLMWGNARTQVKIVSRKHEEINHLIAERTNCGTSLLRIETGYLHREQEMILAVISRQDLSRLNSLIMGEDPETFMTINQINEVKGRGFTLKRVYKEARQQRAYCSSRSTALTAYCFCRTLNWSHTAKYRYIEKQGDEHGDRAQ